MRFAINIYSNSLSAANGSRQAGFYIELCQAQPIQEQQADEPYVQVLAKAKANIALWQDSGYQGFSACPYQHCAATEKPKGKELTQEQKERNTSPNHL